ncbi:MAG: hypothetical protein HOV71_08455 [Hamadaea sp.]|nr:hypothetical protein [Hamadaea sp.]NUT08673.1 hypothetical protein [Hamadaea sp.]
MPNTPLSALPYPTLASPNNPPSDIQALANALDPLATPQIQTWTPTWTQQGGTALAIGNGTLEGKYVKIGRAVVWRLYLLRGSTTNFGTAYYLWSLPVAADSQNQPVGTGMAQVGGSFKMLTCRLAGNQTVAALRPDDSNLGNATFPWATGDSIMLGGTYLAAS